MLVAVGIVVLLLCGSKAPYELGYAGKPGTLTIDYCGPEEAGPHNACTGYFDSADGTIVGEYFAKEDFGAHPTGTKLHRQREAPGELDQLGLSSVTVSGSLVGVALIGAGAALRTRSRCAGASPPPGR